jgi:hypothetical protein
MSSRVQRISRDLCSPSLLPHIAQSPVEVGVLGPGPGLQGPLTASGVGSQARTGLCDGYKQLSSCSTAPHASRTSPPPCLGQHYPIPTSNTFQTLTYPSNDRHPSNPQPGPKPSRSLQACSIPLPLIVGSGTEGPLRHPETNPAAASWVLFFGHDREREARR